MRSLFLFVFVIGYSTTTAQSTFTFKWDVTSKFPKPIGWVSDYERILSKDAIQILEKKIIEHERKTKNEIAVVTIDTIGNYPAFFEYSVSLFGSWGIGKQDGDNGILILFSSKMRRVRIATGIALENKLTDDFCQEVIDEIMIPQFKQNHFSEGLIKGLDKIIQQLEK